jgi:hypothetical protein
MGSHNKMSHQRIRRPKPRKPIIGGTCPDCGKTRFYSRREARQAANRLSKRARVYQCGEYWHWTSWQPAGRTTFYRERERPGEGDDRGQDDQAG